MPKAKKKISKKKSETKDEVKLRVDDYLMGDDVEILSVEDQVKEMLPDIEKSLLMTCDDPIPSLDVCTDICDDPTYILRRLQRFDNRLFNKVQVLEIKNNKPYVL